MKKIILISLFYSLLSSCTTYQYVTFHSDELQLKENVYVHEKNGLEVSYDFWGRDMPISLSVKNNNDYPIIINWAESGVIFNGHQHLIFDGSSQVDLNTSGLAISNSDGDIHRIWASTKGVINNGMHQMILFPNAFTFQNIPPVFTQPLPKHPENYESVLYDEEFMNKFYKFNKEITPIKLTTHITIYKGEGFTQKEVISNEFYLSQKMSSKISPNYIKKSPRSAFTILNDSESAGAGVIGFFLISLGLILAISVLFS